MKKETIMRKIDKLSSYNEKLEYLNNLFLKAKTSKQEDMILILITELKFWGK